MRRNLYTQLLEWKNSTSRKPLILEGARQVGKTWLLDEFGANEYKYYIKINCDNNPEVKDLFADYDVNRILRIVSAISKTPVKPCETLIFFDEIQNVEDFQRVVDSLFLDENLDLYLTGSNAYLLSGELATLLSGRFITIEMLPLSFKEFCSAADEGLSLSEKYRLYIERSSFPYALNFGGNKMEMLDYLHGIYSTIVLKDVVSRSKISDPKMLESIVRFIFDSIGSPISAKRIADTMVSSGRKIDAKTVEKYISALQNSFIIYEAKRYDIRGKQCLKLLEKYYSVDTGLRFLLLGQRANNVGHILENIVYLELIRRKYDVYVGKIDDMEIDFVAQSEEGNLYVQVAASVRDENTLERELRPLKLLRDSYPKLLLTLDDDPIADYEGIKRMNALDWLLQ